MKYLYRAALAFWLLAFTGLACLVVGQSPRVDAYPWWTPVYVLCASAFFAVLGYMAGQEAA